MRFRSDATAQRSAFALTVRAMDACQRNYTSLSGRIASNRLRTCDTHIEVPPNYTIALYFTKFALYPNDHLLACTEANAPVKVSVFSKRNHFDFGRLKIVFSPKDVGWRRLKKEIVA